MRGINKTIQSLIVPVFLILMFCLPATVFAQQSSDLSKDTPALKAIAEKATGLAGKNVLVEDEEYFGPAAIVEDKLDLGKKVFFKRCVWCHGVKGEGDGPSAKLLITNPRNFLTGTFKIRQTDSGEFPFESDLIRTVTTGLPGSAMPAWGGILSADEIASVVQFVKTLLEEPERWVDEEEEINLQDFGGKRGENPFGAKAPYYIGASEEVIKEGHAIFIKNKCFECHGTLGRGDGNPTMKDDWGFTIVAANWQQCWNFRGSRRDPYDIFNVVRTVSTGLNGTPMPNFKDSITVEDRWKIGAFVNSLCPRREIDGLTQKPKTDPYITVTHTKGKISHDMNDAMWQASYDDKRIAAATQAKDYTLFPSRAKGDMHRHYIAASGQLTVGKRNFPSHIDNFWITARWSEEENAAYFLVEYHNRFLGTGRGEAIAVQLAASADGPRPGLIFGDAGNAVNVVKATLTTEGYDETLDAKEEGYPVSVKVENLVGNGYQAVKAGGAKSEVVASHFNRGKMSILFKIPLDGSSLAVGKYAPTAFLQWAGRAKETDEILSHSGWNYAVLQGSDGSIPTFNPPVPPAASAAASGGKNPYTGSGDGKLAFEDVSDEYMKHVTEGGKAYFQNCHQCHGDQLNGLGMMSQAYSPSPTNFTVKGVDEGTAFTVISEGGGAGSQMPAFKDHLSSDQIWEVVTFLKWYTGK